MTKKVAWFLMVSMMLLYAGMAFAGTGGMEVQSIWTDITNMLQGTLGKIIAIFLIGFAIKAAFSGAVLPAIMFFVLGLGIGMLPGIVNARFTLTV